MRPAGLSPLLLVLLLLVSSPAFAADEKAGDDLIAGLAPDTPVHLSADHLVRDEEGHIEATGNVRISAGPMTLGADRIRYDPEAQTAELEGSVTLVDRSFVARAVRAFVDLQAQSGVLEEAALFEKVEPPDPEALLAAEDVLAVRAAGKNDLEIHAERVSRQTDGSYSALHPSVTTCDCGEGTPDWRLVASSATLSPNDRLKLSWPVLYAKSVPILASPFLSLPMTNQRKSGLLFAVPHIAGRRGPSYEQPVYIVLGHSYDMTLSAGWYFGHATPVTSEDGQAQAQAPPGTVVKEDAFRGPRGSAEFRYTSRIGTAGRAFVAYGFDLSKRGDLVPGASPNRFGIQADHSDDWGGGFADRLALNLVSDRNYLRDFVDDIVLRGEQTLRSTAWAAYRQDSAIALVEGSVLQDLRPAFGPGVPVPTDFFESLRLFGPGSRDTFQRLPAAAVDLARLPLPWGAGLSLHLGGARFAPWTRAGFGDYGVDGLGPGDAGYPGPDLGEGDLRFEEGELPSVDRVSIRPTLSLPILAGRYLSLTPYGGWREQLYRYGEGQGSGVASWGVVGAAAHTELARTYSSGVRHAWIPKLEVRGLLRGHERNVPVRAYDELDLRPLRTSTQAQAKLATRLDVPGPGGGALAMEAAAGQNALLTPNAQLAETFGEVTASLWPFQISGLLQWDPRREIVTEAVGEGSWSDRRGDQLRASYRRLGQGGSARLRAAPDELFSDRFFTELTSPQVLQGLEQIGAGATVVPLRGLSLSYDLLFLPDLTSSKLLQQRASIGYLSSCECWSGTLHFAKRREEGLDFWVSFNLGRM